MIARTWSARVTPDNEAAYLRTVRDVVLPELRAAAGYEGAHFLRRAEEGTVHILVVTYWTSMAAAEALGGGADPSKAYVPPEIAALLSSFDGVVEHFEVAVDD